MATNEDCGISGRHRPERPACADLAPGKIAFMTALIAIETASIWLPAQHHIPGFASTIFWPITTALHAHLSWQNVYLIFAAINLLVCLPIHAWLSRSVSETRKREGD